MNPEVVIQGPILSEKSAQLLEHGVYGIKVHPRASKSQISQALKDVFGVDVVQIRTLIVRGDLSRRARSKGSTSSVTVKAPNVKKAYIWLRDGQSLPVPMAGKVSE